MERLLIIDCGHAEYVEGKQAPDKSMREWEFNNDMQYKIKALAEKHGISVFLTNPNPQKKDEMGLTKRSELANKCYIDNKKPKTIMISLHSNAFGGDFNKARGTETYIASNGSTASKNFAKDLNTEIVKTFKLLDKNALDRGVKVEDFTVIYKSIMPTCLVEYGFYSNKDDLKILKNNRNDLAEATMKAICKYFGITYQPPVVEKPKVEVPKEEKHDLWAVCVTACDYESAKKMKEKLIKEGYEDTYLIPR